MEEGSACAGWTSESGRGTSPPELHSTKVELKRLHLETYTAAVQDVEWLEEGCLAVALKGTNYLRLFSTITMQVCRHGDCCGRCIINRSTSLYGVNLGRMGDKWQAFQRSSSASPHLGI